MKNRALCHLMEGFLVEEMGKIENMEVIERLRNGTLIKYVFMRSYLFFLQDKKRRRCRASTRLFNEVEWENSKQKNVILLLNHS